MVNIINDKSLVLGVMSGTSMDGLDCCLSEIFLDNEYNLEYKIVDFKTYPYDRTTKDIIKKAISQIKSDINTADIYLGILFLDFSKDFIKSRKIDLIGSHGQTILHNDKITTLQIGNPKFLRSYFKVPTIFNFRKNDIIYHGNGAPLVSFLDWLLILGSSLGRIFKVQIFRKTQ